MKIFTNHIPFYPFDQCILSRKDLKLSREADFHDSSVLYLNLDSTFLINVDARMKLFSLSEMTEQIEANILNKGYKRMAIIELNYDHKGIRKNITT
jgi:hypothetical protein